MQAIIKRILHLNNAIVKLDAKPLRRNRIFELPIS